MTIWNTMEHNGVLLCNPYKPHGKPICYESKYYNISEKAEEILSSILHKQEHLEDPVFYRNFYKSLYKYLPNELKKINIKHFTFPGWKPYTYTFDSFKLDLRINGIIYQLQGSPAVEPPHIFIGRGEHPLRGTFKSRLTEKHIILNMSKTCFKKFELKDFVLIENKTVAWIASWKDQITKEPRYIFLPKSFHSNDVEKFDLARLLKRKLQMILSKNKINLQEERYEQCAICVHLIYKLCIRVGNEKDTNIDSDTIGCCSICKHHIKLLPNRRVMFKFLGKDSIPFKRTITMDPEYHSIFENIHSNSKMEMFENINPGILNRYLNKLLPGLTAKVFRTMRASTVFQHYIGNDLQSFKIANKKAADICNHTNNTTSKNNYIDPRIIYNFSNKTNIPVEKLMSTECIKKHQWAKHTNTNFVF